MAQFEQLQELWQRQPQANVTPAEAADVARLLRSYSRKQSWINAGKAVVCSALLALSFLQVRSSTPATIGLALAAAVSALLLIADWRSQRAIARRDFAAPSAGFVRETVERLHVHRDSIRRYWPLVGVIVIAVNLILPSGRPVWKRALVSALPFAGFQLGLVIRRMRFDLESRPLLEKLRAIQSALEDHRA
jgi:hypothetical protein